MSTSLKLLNYLKNTEFKILTIIPGVVTAKRVAGIRGDPCGAVRLTHSSPLSTRIPYGCLQRVTIPEAVVIQFVLLRMSSVLPETC